MIMETKQCGILQAVEWKVAIVALAVLTLVTGCKKSETEEPTPSMWTMIDQLSGGWIPLPLSGFFVPQTLQVAGESIPKEGTNEVSNKERWTQFRSEQGLKEGQRLWVVYASPEKLQSSRTLNPADYTGRLAHLGLDPMAVYYQLLYYGETARGSAESPTSPFPPGMGPELPRFFQGGYLAVGVRSLQLRLQPTGSDEWIDVSSQAEVIYADWVTYLRETPHRIFTGATLTATREKYPVLKGPQYLLAMEEVPKQRKPLKELTADDLSRCLLGVGEEYPDSGKWVAHQLIDDPLITGSLVVALSPGADGEVPRGRLELSLLMESGQRIGVLLSGE